MDILVIRAVFLSVCNLYSCLKTVIVSPQDKQNVILVSNLKPMNCGLICQSCFARQRRTMFILLLTVSTLGLLMGQVFAPNLIISSVLTADYSVCGCGRTSFSTYHEVQLSRLFPTESFRHLLLTTWPENKIGE